MIIINFYTPKGVAELELLFNKPASEDSTKILFFWRTEVRD